MSVINTMLKDLERRGVDSSNAGDAILNGMSSSGDAQHDGNSSNKIYLISLTAVIAVIILLAAGYYLSPYKLVSVAGNNIEMAATEPAPVDTTLLEEQAEPVLAEQKLITQVETTLTESEEPAQSTLAQQTVTTDLAIPATPMKQTSQAKQIKATPVDQTHIAASAKTPKAPASNSAASEIDNDSLDESTADSLLVVNKQRREYTAAERSQQTYATALKLYNRGEKQVAKSALTEALSFDIRNIDAYRLLTIIYFEDGRADLAAESVAQGLSLFANDQSLLRLQLQALVQLGKYQDAIVVMEQRLRLTGPDDLGYLAGLYQKNNDHLNAVKLYAQALQLIPTKSIWWMGQGISLEFMEQYKDAMQSYEKSISTGQLSTRLTEYAISRMNLIKQHNAGSVS